MQIKNAAALVLTAALQALPSYACSIEPRWRPPSLQSAYETAQVVVHGRVVSQTGGHFSTVTMDTMRILKGRFSGNAVENLSSGMCGINLINGAEYVFFFPKGAGYRVSFFSQPAETAAEILRLLPRDASGLLVPEPARPSGRHLQRGLRASTRATTNDPDPLFNMQIDLGSQELCESSLAAVPKDTQMSSRSTFGGDWTWCSPESASAKLKYHGRFTNSKGKSFYIETDSVEQCQAIADQSMTAGVAARKAIELSLKCQAR